GRTCPLRRHSGTRRQRQRSAHRRRLAPGVVRRRRGAPHGDRVRLVVLSGGKTGHRAQSSVTAGGGVGLGRRLGHPDRRQPREVVAAQARCGPGTHRARRRVRTGSRVRTGAGVVKYNLRPLDRVSSIKTKLGLLVAVTIVVASVLAVIGTRLGISPWATVPVAVVVALAVTQLLARGMTSPLREMTLAAQRMAQGDYSQRVHTSSRDEVGELARAFNRTAATLEMVDRHRRDLVANVSHELRTPIAALQAVLENLVDGVSNPGPGELRTALAQTERLGRLVGDLLDLSRVEEGVTPLQLKEVRLSDIFDDAVAQARADGVRYAVDVRPESLTVAADPDRLHQLLANLLDNAARHSPSGGEVTLSAERLGDDIQLAVADEGPG